MSRRGFHLGLSFGTGFLVIGLVALSIAAVSIIDLNTGIPGTESGQMLLWNGTTWQLSPAAGNPKYRAYFQEEFWTGTCSAIGSMVGAPTGTTTCTFTSSDGSHPGAQAITTGTTATEGERMSLPATVVTFGTYPQQLTALWKIHNLGSSVDWYKDNVGFLDPLSNVEPLDGAWAAYNQAVSGVTKWAFVTSNNGTQTVTACTGTTGDISADTWYELKIAVNAAASSATLTINGALCATSTTNIPTGTARQTGVGYQHYNASGSVPIAQFSVIDYLEYSVPFSPAR